MTRVRTRNRSVSLRLQSPRFRAKQTLKIILPVVFFVIFLLLYMVFHSVSEALVLIFPTFYAMSGGLILQWLLGYLAHALHCFEP